MAVDVTEGRAAGQEQSADLLSQARVNRRLFAEVYQRYRLPVYRYIRTQIPSDDDAADLTAETFERAIRAIHTYRGSGSEVGWLLRIARNAAIDTARRRIRVRRHDEESADEAGTADPPEVTYLVAERRLELQRAVATLPASTRDAIALRYAVGLATREIATVLGKSEAATQKLISRGLAALREDHHVER